MFTSLHFLVIANRQCAQEGLDASGSIQYWTAAEKVERMGQTKASPGDEKRHPCSRGRRSRTRTSVPRALETPDRPPGDTMPRNSYLCPDAKLLSKRGVSANGLLNRTIVIVASCELAGVEPFAWFQDVLTRVGACSLQQLDELPHRWVAARRRQIIRHPGLLFRQAAWCSCNAYIPTATFGNRRGKRYATCRDLPLLIGDTLPEYLECKSKISFRRDDESDR